MDTFIDLFSYDFFLHAFWASLFSAISCGLIGTYIVSRRIVFISGGITHASFGGIGIGYFLGLNPLLGAAVFSVLSALGIQFFTQKGKLREDSSIAIWWSLGMAIGIIFIYLSPGYAPNLMSYLFGSILTVSTSEIWLMAALSLVLVVFFLIMYRAILYIAFNEEFAKATGLPVKPDQLPAHEPDCHYHRPEHPCCRDHFNHVTTDSTTGDSQFIHQRF